jgi:hypothetical protein
MEKLPVSFSATIWEVGQADVVPLANLFDNRDRHSSNNHSHAEVTGVVVQ